MYKFLPVILMCVSGHAHAKNELPPTDTIPQTATTYATISPRVAAPLAGIAPALYGGRSETSVHFFYAIELGYSHATAATDSTHTKAGGFMYKGNLGVMIELKNADTRTGLLAFSVGGEGADMLKHNFTMYCFPVSYTSLSFGRRENGWAFYWQIGASFNYLGTVKNDNDVVFTSHFSKFMVEPTVSAGFHLPFRLLNRRGGSEIGHGRASVGPYLSYVVNNMSTDPGITMHAYKVGVRWTYIFM